MMGSIVGLSNSLSSLKILLSAMRQPRSTMELLQTELDWGYVIGPYDSILFSCYRISPYG